MAETLRQVTVKEMVIGLRDEAGKMDDKEILEAKLGIYELVVKSIAGGCCYDPKACALAAIEAEEI